MWSQYTHRLRLVGRKTFSRKTVFLYFQFYIVWLAKECKTIFPWGKITLPRMENHFPFKMKGKLFSFFLLYTPLTTSLLSLSFSFHFIIFFTSNQTMDRKTNFGIVFSIVNCFPWKSFYTENILRPTKRSPNITWSTNLKSYLCLLSMVIKGIYANTSSVSIQVRHFLF